MKAKPVASDNEASHKPGPLLVRPEISSMPQQGPRHQQESGATKGRDGKPVSVVCVCVENEQNLVDLALEKEGVAWAGRNAW